MKAQVKAKGLHTAHTMLLCLLATAVTCLRVSIRDLYASSAHKALLFKG